MGNSCKKREGSVSRVRDFINLCKPSITGMCVLMTAGGYWFAPGTVRFAHFLVTLLATTLVVAGSCVLNMFMEREYDALMSRTSHRPLPSKRIKAHHACMFGFFLALSGLFLFAFFVNGLTSILSGVAFISYVWIYTPLKRVTWASLLVGTIPGAMPPLMGWTAATGAVQLPGLVLFCLMIVWQLPHFIALSLIYKHDYKKAGIVTLPLVHGDWVAKLQALGYTIILLPISLSLVPLGMAGNTYFIVALFVGFWFLFVAIRGMLPSASVKSSYNLFFASLVYLPLLVLGLVIDTFVL